MLTKGGAATVLTSDGTDILWSAPASPSTPVRIRNLDGPDNLANPNSTYTSSGTWSKGALGDDDLVCFYLVGGGGGGSSPDGAQRAFGGQGGVGALIFGTAGYFNGAAYVVGAGGAGESGASPGNPGAASTLTLTANAGASQAFTTGPSGNGQGAGAGTGGLIAAVDPEWISTTFSYQVGTIVVASTSTNASYIKTLNALSSFSPVPSTAFAGGISGTGQSAGERNGASCLLGGGGGASFRANASSDPQGTGGVSNFAGNGGGDGTNGANGAVPGGGGSGKASGTAFAGGAGSVRVYHI